jgi:ribosomal protein S18 acetylase RimI-like enzyme
VTAFEIRRLGPGYDAILTTLAVDGDRYAEDGEDETDVPLSAADARAFLADDTTHLLIASDPQAPGGTPPLGFVVANELRHRHSFARLLIVYEIGVDRAQRRRGIGRALLDAVADLARDRGVPEGFVITNESNAPAMALYASAGGTRPSLDVAEWDFDYRERVEPPERASGASGAGVPPGRHGGS